jgi:hypothetical protein
MGQSLTPGNTSPSKERWLETAQNPRLLAQALKNISSGELKAWARTAPAFHQFIIGLAARNNMNDLLPLKRKQK